MTFENEFTLLKDLQPNEIFLSKGNFIGVYLKAIDDNKHLISDFKNQDKPFEVPHGNFPIFKKK